MMLDSSTVIPVLMVACVILAAVFGKDEEGDQ